LVEDEAERIDGVVEFKADKIPVEGWLYSELPTPYSIAAGTVLHYDTSKSPSIGGTLFPAGQFLALDNEFDMFGLFSNDGVRFVLGYAKADGASFVFDEIIYDNAESGNGGWVGVDGEGNRTVNVRIADIHTGTWEFISDGGTTFDGWDWSADWQLATWGAVSYLNLSDVESAKQNVLTAGANIDISTSDPHNPVISALTVLPEVTSPDGLIADAKLTAGLIAAAAAVTRDRGVVVSAYADKQVYVADEITIEYRGGNYALGDSLQYAPPNGLMDVLVVATELGSGDSIEGFTVSSPGASETDFAGSDIPFTTSGAGVLATFNITTKLEAGRKLADVVSPTEGDVVRVLVDETHGGQMYQWVFADTNNDGISNWIALAPAGSTRDFFTEPIQSGELGAKVVEDGKVADTDTGSIVEDDNKFTTDATFTFGNLKKAFVSKINALFSNKVDKLTEAGNYLYSHNGANQADIGYSMAPTVSSIAQRHVGGALEVGDPTTDADATHKGYVDTADTAVRNYADELFANKNENFVTPIDGTNLGLTQKELVTRRYSKVVIGSTGAGYTATDVDFLCTGSNDSTQFDAALAAIPTAGGEIKILNGTYTLTKPWAIERSNVKISGCGGNSTIIQMTGTRNATDTPEAAKSNNAVVYLAGNKCVIEGLHFTHGTATDGLSYSVYLNGVTNTTLTGNTCYNVSLSTGYGVYLNACFNNKIIDNKFNHTNTGHTHGIYLNAGGNNTIAGNILNNTTSNSYAYGITLNSSHHNNITGNASNASTTANNGIAHGFYISSGSNYNTITDNTCTSSAKGYCYSVIITGSSNNIVTGNICECVSVGYSSSVVLGSGASGNVVTGNVCANGGTGTRFGVWVQSNNNNNNNNNVSDNIFGGATEAFTGFCLHIAGTSHTYNQFQNNNLRNWVQYGTGAFTKNGSTAATLPGSSTTIELFDVGTENVAGFNMV
jgi:hypothetical protein